LELMHLLVSCGHARMEGVDCSASACGCCLVGHGWVERFSNLVVESKVVVLVMLW
jgi:hypothetical protein